MLKEIYEQPQTIQETIRVHVKGNLIFPSSLSNIEIALLNFKKIIIAASGSSRHAGLAGEIMIEDLSGVAVDVEYASEYCYRSTHATADQLVVVITQSGETADTIAAQREALNRAARTVAISNVVDSTIAREANATLVTQAGLEKAVPATKSFTAQLTILYLFALFLARKRGRMTSEVIRTHLNALAGVPEGIAKFLGSWDKQADECS
ncbi:MAG: SIS domain-containing protein, partial [Candidatus Acidiferrales bacterium]